MATLLNELNILINKYKLYENAIVFNGMDSPFFDLIKARLIFKDELENRVLNKIASINEQIEIAEEDHNHELIERLIMHRRKIRNLLDEEFPTVQSIDDFKFPYELEIDHSQFTTL